MRVGRIVLAIAVSALLWPTAGAAGSPGSGAADADGFCLIEKEDVVLEGAAVETFHEETSDLAVVNQTVVSTPKGPADEPIIFAAARLEADRLCAKLSFEHAPVEVEMEGVDMREVSISGRVMELTYDSGQAGRLTLWISLKSALELLPELGDAMDERSANATRTATSGP